MTTITNASTAVTTASTGVHHGRAFCEHLWRTAGLQYVALFTITTLIFGYWSRAESC